MERSEAYDLINEIDNMISTLGNFCYYEKDGYIDWEHLYLVGQNATTKLKSVCDYVINTGDREYFENAIYDNADRVINLSHKILQYCISVDWNIREQSFQDLQLQKLKDKLNENRQIGEDILKTFRENYVPNKDDLSFCKFMNLLSLMNEYADNVYKFYNKMSDNPDNNNEEGEAHLNCNMTDEQLTSIFDALKQNKFIASNSTLEDWLYICKGGTERATTQKIIWTAKNTKNRGASKKSLLDLLISMGIKQNDITPETINGCFAVEGAKDFVLQDIPPIFKDWKEETKSEYHDQIKAIVSKSKQKQK